MINFTKDPSTSPLSTLIIVYTGLGHKGGEEFSEKRTNILNYVQ